jgi:hypothetical protein
MDHAALPVARAVFSIDRVNVRLRPRLALTGLLLGKQRAPPRVRVL